MFGAIPAMPIVEDLVPARPALKLYDEYGLHLGAFTRCRPRVNGFDSHAFWKEIELTQATTGLVDSLST
jgi:hypothetical protein